MKKLVIFLSALLVISVGLLTCLVVNNDISFTKRQKELNDSTSVVKTLDKIDNPVLTDETMVADFHASFTDNYKCGETFANMSNDVVVRVFRVLNATKPGKVYLADIVQEYLAHKDIYDNVEPGDAQPPIQELNGPIATQVTDTQNCSKK